MRIYLSKQGYDKKPDKSASIIKTLNSYDLVDIDPESLYKKLINGHFIHHECGCSESNTGSKCYTFKKTLLKQTQIICIDLDYKLKDTKINKITGDKKIITKHYEPNEMPVWNDELLSDLKYTNSLGQEIDITPTFWMESFSAHKVTDMKIVGNSVHLFYVFEDPISNVIDFLKTSISIMVAIDNALKCKGYEIPKEKGRNPFDPVSYDMFQGLWGSFNKLHGYSGKTYFYDVFRDSYKPEYKDFMFPWKIDSEDIDEDDIKRTIEAYSTVKSLDDIDINKCQYIKYKEYFGHEETFHIISVLKHEYSLIENQVNSKQSLCYQVCKKLLLEHSNDFFDNDEEHFYHEYKRCKIYTKKGTNEAAYLNHVIKLIGDTGAIPMIQYKEMKDKENNVIKLKDNEYLSDKKTDILRAMRDDKLNFIVAEPGLGKTVFAKSLEGRTLIIELFNSIIRSEEKFDSNEFVKFKDDYYIKDDNISRLNVCSANKFVFWYKNKDNGYMNSFLDEGKCLFDNIILDESHLLCLSHFRYDVMGDTIECLLNLKMEYPDVKVIIMTGTPFGESIMFEGMLNRIDIISNPRYTKKFFMIQTTSIVGYMKELIKDSLSKGLRIFIPVDSENWFDTFIDSCIKDGIIKKDKTYYFNQPKHNEETEQYILDTKLIGDIQILGTSSYMSVGIDLEDWKTEFVTIIPSGASMTGNFSGFEVDQFANRHRKQNLEVHYVISDNESNNKKPMYMSSCKALLDIKNELLISLYRTNPIVIKMPLYLINDNDKLEVHEYRYKSYCFYKDMKPIISHPVNIYEYMQKHGWECEWKKVDNTHRGINTKEHRDEEKEIGVKEFMSLINIWAESGYPCINVKDNIYDKLSIIKHQKDYSLFDVESLDVEFTNYYAKNTLFGMFLKLREYLTPIGTYNLIKDAYDEIKINMSLIDRTLLGIKLINNYNKTGVWQEIYDRLSEFYSRYSTVDNGVYKDNKKQFEQERNNVVQEIWDKLTERIDDDMLRLAFKTNYEGVTDSIIDGFMEGVKLIQSMYCEKEFKQKKINKKNTRVTVYHWNNNLLSKYEIRKDKKTKW